jgi:glycosyltransferase involved in cell wall biosynthesis
MARSAEEKILVHATNISGLGANQLVASVLGAFETLGYQGRCVLAIPTDGILGARNFDSWPDVIRYRRARPRSVSRLTECLFPGRRFPRCAASLVLGDIPLRGMRNQVVLFHSPHLIPPRVNPLSEDTWRLRCSRAVFSLNLKFVRALAVQSDVIRKEVEESWPQSRAEIAIITQPPPEWALGLRNQWKQGRRVGPLRLFYPAMGYPHKNHALLQKMGDCQPAEAKSLLSEVTVTVGLADEAYRVDYPSWVKNAGRLGTKECVAAYLGSDALFFPSLRESFGLPLVEAMVFGAPIVCADLPYARWLCGDEAIYFDPRSPKGAWAGLEQLQARLRAGWTPNWQSALLKISPDWSLVAERLIGLASPVPIPRSTRAE